MSGEERRKYERLKRPFIISYQVEADSSASYDVTQIKDISLGGMRFVTCKAYAPETLLSIELRTPFKEERIKLKGHVIESKETALNLIYDTRVKFLELDEDTKGVLSKTINLFLKKDPGKEIQ
jgi:c-di-GMP-binding flagellar brake protein YcgR